MKPEQIFGPKQDIRAILLALGIKEGVRPKLPEPFFSPRDIVEVSVDNRAQRTQKDWIGYFNSRNEAMMSMPDLYHAGKSNNLDLLGALQKDFKDSYVVTSTRPIYQPDSLDARVVHYFRSNIVKPVEFGLLVPNYSKGKRIKKALDDPLGLAFLQAIFCTEDGKEAILETLVNLSGKSENKIKVWTPDQESRKKVLERQLLCDAFDSYFRINCLKIGISGCSSLVRS